VKRLSTLQHDHVVGLLGIRHEVAGQLITVEIASQPCLGPSLHTTLLTFTVLDVEVVVSHDMLLCQPLLFLKTI
jgi:hypothetical protein